MKRIEVYISKAGTLHRTKSEAAVADIAAAVGCTPSLAMRIVERRDDVIMALKQIDDSDYLIPVHYPSDNHADLPEEFPVSFITGLGEPEPPPSPVTALFDVMQQS